MKKGRGFLRSQAVRMLDFFGHFRLLTMYAGIILVAAVLFGVSLTVSNRIARDMVRSEYREYNTTIFEQMEKDMNRQMENLTRLCYTAMSNKTLVDFVESSSFSIRTEQMDVVKAEFDRLMALQEDIRAISLHRLDGKMIASAGIKKYIHETGAVPDSIQFSGLIQVEGNNYFAVDIPLFSVDPSRNARKLGSCALLVSMDYLQQSVTENLPGDEFFYLCLDTQGRAMVEKGQPPAGFDRMQQISSERRSEQNGQVIYQATLPRTGWRLLFGVPLGQLFANINRLQRNYYVTYFIIGLLLLLLFVIIYASVIRPIHRQIRFMNDFARDRKSRMPADEKNEMGELARNLNHMLDDLDRLTERYLAAQNQLLEAEYRKKQSELLAFRSQMNPHFLYNTLECIRGMALYHHVDEIAEMSEALSRMLFYNLRGKGYAPVGEVKNRIEDYASIIRYRFNSRVAIQAQADEAAAEVPFPKMVIQPLVENAIFHGLETVESGGTVWARARRQGDRLLVTVEDNGLGMTEEELAALKSNLNEYDRTGAFPSRSHGIGLLNIYRRLRLFYGDALRFEVESAAGKGTAVRIDVPCEVKEMEKEDVSGFSD